MLSLASATYRSIDGPSVSLVLRILSPLTFNRLHRYRYLYAGLDAAANASP